MTWFENTDSVVSSDVYICHKSVHTYTSHVEPLVTRPYLYLPAYDTSEIWQLQQLVGWSQQKSQEFEVFEFFVHPKISWGFSTGTS